MVFDDKIIGKFSSSIWDEQERTPISNDYSWLGNFEKHSYYSSDKAFECIFIPTSPIVMHNVSKVSKDIVPLTKCMSLVIDKIMLVWK